MKKKQWTELQLLIVYYIARFGLYGALPFNNGVVKSNDVIDYLGHGYKSFQHCYSKFCFIVGIELPDEFSILYPGYNPSQSQRGIVKLMANKTVSQVRKLIWDEVRALESESNINTLDNEESSLEQPKTTPNGQLIINFPDYE